MQGTEDLNNQIIPLSNTTHDYTVHQEVNLPQYPFAICIRQTIPSKDSKLFKSPQGMYMYILQNPINLTFCHVIVPR